MSDGAKRRSKQEVKKNECGWETVKGEKEEGEGKGDEDWGRQTGNNLAQVCVCVVCGNYGGEV
jgi:hypothetical protein